MNEDLVEANMAAIQDPVEYVSIVRYSKNKERVIKLLHKRFSVQDYPDIRSAILAHKRAPRELDYLLAELDHALPASQQRTRI